MKDITEAKWRDSRPSSPPEKTIKFCLECIFQDKTKRFDDLVCERLTFEELIGALLQAEDMVESREFQGN